jgi:hypothetical protein
MDSGIMACHDTDRGQIIYNRDSIGGMELLRATASQPPTLDDHKGLVSWAVGTTFHEEVHGVMPENLVGKGAAASFSEYQTAAGRLLEQGTAEAWTSSHYKEFADKAGYPKWVGNLGYPPFGGLNYDGYRKTVDGLVSRIANETLRDPKDILDDFARETPNTRMDKIAEMMLDHQPWYRTSNYLGVATGADRKTDPSGHRREAMDRMKMLVAGTLHNSLSQGMGAASIFPTRAQTLKGDPLAEFAFRRMTDMIRDMAKLYGN